MIEKIVRLKADTEYIAPQYRDNTDNDMSMIVYLPDSPLLEGEQNYQQQLQAMQMRRLVRTIIGRSTLLNPITPAATGNANELRLHSTNGVFYAALDGIVKTVTAYDSPVTGVRSEGGNRVTLPQWDVSGRVDLVYLEIWFEEVMAVGGIGTADTTIYKNGMVHGFTEVNNLKVVTYNDLHETARRVQLRGRIRVSPGRDNVVGLLAKDSAIYSYSDRGGYFVAGDGDTTSANNLITVDGFSYAMPLVTVTRGADALTYSAITVVAPNTATLQQLASSTLKDVSQFGTDISDLKATTGQHSSSILSLQQENEVLKTQISGVSTQLATANTKVAALEKSLGASRNRYVSGGNRKFNNEAETFNAGTWNWGHDLFVLPANHRLKIDKVYALLPDLPGCQFRLDIHSVTTRLDRRWTWNPTVSNGGTYNYLGWFLSRERESQIIDLPEYDNTVDQFILVRTYLITPARLAIGAYDYIYHREEFTMTPK